MEEDLCWGEVRVILYLCLSSSSIHQLPLEEPIRGGSLHHRPMGGYDGDGRGGDVGRRDSGEMVAEIRSSDNKQNHKQACCAIKSTEESTQHPREEVQG